MPDRSATEPEFWKEALAPSEACLTLEDLVRLSNRSISREAVARAHVAACARCQTELAMLREYQSATTHPEESAAVSWITAELERRFDQIKQIKVIARLPASRSRPDPERSTGWRRLLLPRSIRAAAFASAALLAAIVVGLNLRGGQAPELASDLVRGPQVFRSEELVAVGPTGDLKEVPAELRWQAIAAAARYRVKVMEVDRAELWQTESSQTSAILPAAVRAKIVPGKTLLWQVTAIDSASKPVAASQILRFRVAIGSSSDKD
jgi:hypothetical protein